MPVSRPARWHFTQDPDAFRRVAGRCAEREAARNTPLLTQLDVPGVRGWWGGPDGPDGEGAGLCQVVGEPGVLLLGAMPVDAARELAGRLPGEGRVSTVRGETGAVEAYADACGREVVGTRRMRLFR